MQSANPKSRCARASLARAALRLALLIFTIAGASARASVNLTVALQSTSNNYMSAAAYATENLKVVTDGRWLELYRYPTNWMISGSGGSAVSAGNFVFFCNRITDYYQTAPTIVTIPDGLTTNQVLSYAPYSNSLTLSISGQPAGSNAAWSFTAYPAEFTNSTAFTTAGTNTTTLSPIPTGTYSVAFPASFKGYSTPTATNIVILADRISTSAVSYVAYTNAISVTVKGITATTNATWGLTGQGCVILNLAHRKLAARG